MLSVRNPLFLKQSDVFLLGLLPIWMNLKHVGSFTFEATGSNVTVVSDSYRIVFLLNLTHSMKSVDSQTGFIKSNLAFETLSKCLYGLLQQFSDITLKFRISVIAHGPSKKIKTLIQDIQPNLGNIHQYLKEIYNEALEFENNLLSREEMDIFSTFEEALGALDFLPKDHLPVLVYITDGVSVSRNYSKAIGYLPMRLVYS